MDEITDDLSYEMPEIIPAVDMVVDDTPIVLKDDDKPHEAEEHSYGKEMIESGLVQSDVDYFYRAYKNIEDVKYIKMHCTSCDRHIGSAPANVSSRYMHPLLKVLLCVKCFVFYTSGEFTTDSDGSEMYCRWCGEGGQVFCCATCPFVFCKRCIKRNLGGATAKSIQNSDNWLCFACDPEQICRLRATYWAVQKYAEEINAKAETEEEKENLKIDANICCVAGKKSNDVYNRFKLPLNRKRKLLSDAGNSLLQAALEHTKSAKLVKTDDASTAWKPAVIAEEPLDEVICTPDIIPIDDSPPGSPSSVPPPPPLAAAPPPPPLAAAPPPLIPVSRVIPYMLQQQANVKSVPLLTSINVTPSTSKQIVDLHKHLQNTMSQQILLTTPTNMVRNNIIFRQNPAIATTSSNIRLVINNSKPIVAASTLTPTPSLSPITTNSAKTPPIAKQNDWFDQAVINCAEVTEYISTKISALSDVHNRAHKSRRLMEELHNTLQTYLYVAIEKLNKIKKSVENNFENDMKTFVPRKEAVPEKVASPLTIDKPNNLELSEKVDLSESDTESRQSSTQDESWHGSDSKSDDSDSRHSNESRTERSNSQLSFGSAIAKQKNKILTTTNVQPEDVLFDMDVTNASDEEDEDCFGFRLQKSEVIDILDSSDEEKEHKENQKQVKKQKDKEQKEVEKKNKDEAEKQKIEESVESDKKELPVTDKELSLADKKVEEHLSSIENNEEGSLKEKNQKEEKQNDENIETKINNKVIEKNCAKNEENIINENKMEFMGDFEEILSGSVVLRPSIDTKKSFGDEFSKFLGKSNEPDEADENNSNLLDDNSNHSNISNFSLKHELKMNDIFNKDNGSLSLPPVGLGLIDSSSDENSVNNKIDMKSSEIEDKSEDNVILDSEILALKQIAENCVNSPVDIHKTSAECKG